MSQSLESSGSIVPIALSFTKAKELSKLTVYFYLYTIVKHRINYAVSWEDAAHYTKLKNGQRYQKQDGHTEK